MGYLTCSVMPNESSKPGVMLQGDLDMFHQGPNFQGLVFAIGTGCTLTLTGSVTMTLARVVLSFTEHPLRTWTYEQWYSKTLRKYFLVLKRHWTSLKYRLSGCTPSVMGWENSPYCTSGSLGALTFI